MNLDLSHKTALVCGASQGIGAACAKALAELNCKVILLARTENKLQFLVEQLNQSTATKHSYITADVKDRILLKKLITQTIQENNGIDILINNTGGPSFGPILEASDISFLEAMENHLLVNQLLANLVIPHMKTAQFGRIINIISSSVKIPIPGLGVSNTTRWAVAAWAKTLAGEVAPFGITVNSVLPGFFHTERLTYLAKEIAEKENSSPEAVYQAWENSVPNKRLGKPEELANVVAFLASPAATYVNGVAWLVDGGRTGCL